MPATKRNEHGLTAKEDRFCLRYASHGVEYRAYAEAFNVNAKRAISWTRKEAWRLMQKPEIQQRVRQLHLQVEQDAVYDHRQAMLEAHEAYVVAHEQGDARGMVAAAMLKSKLSGLIIEQHRDLGRGLGNMSDAELLRERERVNDELIKLGHRPLALPAPRGDRPGDGGPATIAGEFTEIHRERVADS